MRSSANKRPQRHQLACLQLKIGNLSNNSLVTEASHTETASQVTGFELCTESGPSHGCLDKQADIPVTTATGCLAP